MFKMPLRTAFSDRLLRVVGLDGSLASGIVAALLGLLTGSSSEAENLSGALSERVSLRDIYVSKLPDDLMVAVMGSLTPSEIRITKL
jgi:hypothetical protein